MFSFYLKNERVNYNEAIREKGKLSPQERKKNWERLIENRKLKKGKNHEY